MEINDQKQWDGFVSANGGQFLQSWDWGEFQKSLGRQIWRLAVEENGQTKAASLVIKLNLPLNKNYLFIPRGPLAQNENYFKKIIDEIKKIADAENSIFVRLEPLQQIPNTKYQILDTKPINPHQTLILNLTPSEEDLLSSFHQKTRYNIHLAEKKGITIRQGNSDQDFEIFWGLLQQTYQKQNVKTHPREYYKKMLDTKYQMLDTKIYIAELEGKPIAANLMCYFANTATYNHGGSNYNYRNLMAPHLLQWQQIKDAKAAGYKYYDFRGFDEKTWPGVSRFKSGFGGKIIEYPGTLDLPINKLWYGLYKTARKILV